MNNVLITEAIDKFIESKTATGLEESTIDSYKADLRIFLKYYAQISSTEDLNSNLFNYFIFDQQLDELSNATIARRIAVLKEFFLYLEEQNICKDLIKTISLPKVEKHPIITLTKEEIEVFFGAFNEKKNNELRDKLLFSLMYYSGLRLNETINLKIDDINIKERLISIENSRLVPTSTQLIDVYIEYIDMLKNKELFGHNNYLFFNLKTYKPLSIVAINKNFKRYVFRTCINKKITPHSLRDSFAIHLLQNGCNIHALKELLGHKNLNTTSEYEKYLK